MKVHYSTRYLRLFKKLTHEVQKLASEREQLFRQNPFDPKLETHKLHGKETPHLAFSVNRKIRIKFLLLDDGFVEFVYIGPHDTVYR